jgi:signal transduction histidine kinase
VNPLFVAGFFAAWSAIYLATFAYSLWASRRKLSEPGELPLGLFALSMAVFGLATTWFELGGTSRFAWETSVASELVAAPLLVHFVVIAERSKVPRSLVAATYVVFAALAGLALAGALTRPVAGGIPIVDDHWTPLGQLARGLVLAAGVSVGAAFARQYIAARRGLAAFLGGVLLSVAAAYDFATSFAGGRDGMLTPFGYAAFTLGLFVSRLARFTSRRDRLLRKTNELASRSQALTEAFKELRAAQTEIVRKEQLAAIGELSAVVAHEVRNPLAVISNAVATLNHAGIGADDRTTLLKILEEETTRLNQLVGDLLRYARPLAPETQQIQVRDMIEKAVAHLRSRPNLFIDVEEAEPVGKIAGDALLLRQAIDNVVNNALQAMPNGGTLTIALERLGGEKVALAFRDTGEGMDTVVRKRALDPFFTTRPAGTGLGLAIVARVVDAHGGELVIRSAPDAGTEVSLILPVEPEPAKSLGSRRRLVSISSIPDSGPLEAPDTERPSHPKVTISSLPPKRAQND